MFLLQHQVADIFIKPLGFAAFQHLLPKMSVLDIHHPSWGRVSGIQAYADIIMLTWWHADIVGYAGYAGYADLDIWFVDKLLSLLFLFLISSDSYKCILIYLNWVFEPINSIQHRDHIALFFSIFVSLFFAIFSTLQQTWHSAFDFMWLYWNFVAHCFSLPR